MLYICIMGGKKFTPSSKQDDATFCRRGVDGAILFPTLNQGEGGPETDIENKLLKPYVVPPLHWLPPDRSVWSLDLAANWRHTSTTTTALHRGPGVWRNYGKVSMFSCTAKLLSFQEGKCASPSIFIVVGFRKLCILSWVSFLDLKNLWCLCGFCVLMGLNY